MAYCINSVSFVYVAVSVIGIIVLSFAALRPEKARQEKANERFKEKELSRYVENNRERLKQVYQEFGTQSYGNISEKDRPLWTEEYYNNRRARGEFENTGLAGSSIHLYFGRMQG